MTASGEIILKRGPEAGRTFALHRDTLVLGRDPRCEVVIDHPQVSRAHARITRRDRAWQIEDLDSTNGTFVNGVLLTRPRRLTTGDAIGLSEAVTLIYRETARPADHTRRPVAEPGRERPGRDQEPLRRTYPAGPAPQRPDAVGPPSDIRGRDSDIDPYRTWLWVAIGCAATLLVLGCAAVALLYLLSVLAPAL